MRRRDTESGRGGVEELTVVDGVGFEAVQLEQSVFNGDVADEVEGLHRPHRADAVLFLGQVPRLRPSENREIRR